MLGSLIVYLKGMRIMMFQLSGYYYNRFGLHSEGPGLVGDLRSPAVEDVVLGLVSYWV